MRQFSTILFLLFTLIPLNLFCQNDEAVQMVNKIHSQALTNGKCYDWLRELCYGAGPRIAGSPTYDKAVSIASRQLKEIDKVEVSLQDVAVSYWMRGPKEVVEVIPTSGKKWAAKALALGNSVGTGSKGIKADVIEVKSLEEVEKLGKDRIQGKIVFFNRPMEVGLIRTFSAYGRASDQRVVGPSKAAQFGAVGVIVRSMTQALDDFPHTGTLRYTEGVTKIPAFAISTNDAEKLANDLKKGRIQIFMKDDPQTINGKNSPNVIGEIKGSLSPEKVIVVGGHLDAWDVAQGAHDDGSGCVQAMDVLHILNSLGYKPKNTIRVVLFSNEENGLAGGQSYAERAIKSGETHIAALESDSGGFSPRGFSFDADTSVLKTYFKAVSQSFLPAMESLGYQFELGGSGADIGPLKPTKALLIGLRPDSQRYFDFHHTSQDKFEAVHPRELKLGAAAMTSLIYLIDAYGIK
jgi:carboxypeptidase Q